MCLAGQRGVGVNRVAAGVVFGAKKKEKKKEAVAQFRRSEIKN